MRIVLLIFALICGAAGSQFPEYHQQYVQRMGGTVDELSRQVDGLDQRADQAGLERYAYIRHLLKNSDDIVKAEGQNLLDMVVRYKNLSALLEMFKDIPGYQLAFKTGLYLDGETAVNTLKDYKPALPLTVAGVGHFFGAFLIGYFMPLLLGLFLPRRVAADA